MAWPFEHGGATVLGDGAAHLLVPIRPATECPATECDGHWLVLAEQRIGLEAFLRRRPFRDAAPSPHSAGRRSRMVALALRVLAEAAAAAAAECDRILTTADRQATEIVAAARSDTEQLVNWVEAAQPCPVGADRRVPTDRPVAPVAPTAIDLIPQVLPQPGTEVIEPCQLPDPYRLLEPHRLQADAAAADDEEQPGFGDDFWASLQLSDEDRWAFLDDDDLVGAGRVRRLLRRNSRKPANSSTKGWEAHSERP